MSHSVVHETEKVLDAAIEAVEVRGMKNRYGVIETGGFCSCHGTFHTDSLITVLISVAYLSCNYQYKFIPKQSCLPVLNLGLRSAETEGRAVWYMSSDISGNCVACFFSVTGISL